MNLINVHRKVSKHDRFPVKFAFVERFDQKKTLEQHWSVQVVLRVEVLATILRELCFIYQLTISPINQRMTTYGTAFHVYNFWYGWSPDVKYLDVEIFRLSIQIVDNVTPMKAERSINWTVCGIMIDWSDDSENASDSIRVNREFDSNEIDESDLQGEKQCEPRISTFLGITGCSARGVHWATRLMYAHFYMTIW
jgi:hypothetical protein